MNKLTKEICEKCEGTGKKMVANGEDDFDWEFCDCLAGQRLEDL